MATENTELLDHRYDRHLDIDGRYCKVSFLSDVQAIVYTCFPKSTSDTEAKSGTIHLERPFASREPADFLLINEINHHIQTGEPTK